MAVYHLSVKTISRSAGRSSTGAAAYRAGVEIVDQRTGEVHDYTRKGGVEYSQIVLPTDAPEWAADRAALWNAAEQSETRKNSTVAREFEIALPSELSYDERQRLAVDFAKEIVERHGCAADVAIHAPGKGGDNRNHHAHILCSTRRLTPEGFTEKTRELDERKSGEVDRWRERFATLQNERLQENGIRDRVDHRSLEAQGIDREPTQHLGVAATGYERRTGQASDKRLAFEREAAERLARAKEMGEMEREAKELESSIIDLSGNLSQAKAERDRQKQIEAQEQIEKLKAGLEPTRPVIDRGQLNRAFANAVAKAGLESPQKPVEAVLRQEEGLPLKPDETPVQAVERLKKGYFEEERDTWRKGEASRQAQKSAEYREQAEILRDSEPKKPLIDFRGEYKDKHYTWSKKLGEAEHLSTYHEFRGKSALKGELDHDSGRIEHWGHMAQRRLEKEQPELAQAAKAQRLEEQQKAKEDMAADKALSAFKTHAIKREGGFLGYRDGGKKWEALPDGLKASIDNFNKLPKEARPVVLERMRENLKLKPGEAEKLTEQLERGQGRDKGMER